MARAAVWFAAAAAAAAVAAAISPAKLAAFQWDERYKPAAREAAIVRAGDHVRFSVLKDAVVRVEYSETGSFDDSATLSVLHRDFDVPEFKHSTDGTVTTIETRNLRITYDADESLGAGITAANTKYELLVAPFTKFDPSTPKTGNLHGTFRTLDRVGDPIDLACPPLTSFYVYYCHCEEGVVSRDGWVIIDDSLRPRLDLNAEGSGVPWPRAPPAAALRGDGSYSDSYIFAHGHAYTAAVRDFKDLSGPIPLSPRHALGPAFSRWFQWNDVENIAIVQAGFADHGIPLSLLVVDMDWHHTYPRGLPNPWNHQVEGWTGHTVYPYLFPDTQHFAAYLARRGVKLMFNHHHAAGIMFHEGVYPSMAAAVGVDATTGRTVEFDIANLTWADAYFREVIKPLEDVGVNLDWEDFQQQPVTRVPLLNPTITINHAWYTNPYRYGSKLASTPSKAANGQQNPLIKSTDRPYLMGRFGGLGAHRYPIGFVGDTYVKWEVLRYETYFMPTSSNVLFQWTHDIGGFEGPSPPEFFARHVQFGTFSPSLRTHSSKRSPARAIWTYPQPYFAVMKRFYRLRERLVPYIATAQRIAHETGVQVVRPLYYSFPEAPQAYTDQGLHQYAFGEDVWVAPISAPAAAQLNTTALAAALAKHADGRSVPATFFNASGAPVTNWTFWAPPGRWVEWFSWQAFTSPGPHGAFYARNYGIGEMPVFSPAGAIIPMRTLPANGGGVLGLSAQVPTALTFYVFGGLELAAGASRTTKGRLYDDDGVSVAYEKGEYAWTDVTCDWQRAGANADDAAADADSVTCTVHPPVGAGFDGMPAKRSYIFRFLASLPPASVTVNGHAVAHDPLGAPDANGDNAAWNPDSMAWSYDGGSTSTWVHVGVKQPVAQPLVVRMSFAKGIDATSPVASAGFSRAVSRALSCKEEIDAHYGFVFSSDNEPLLNVTAAVTRMSASAKAPFVAETLAAVPGYLEAALNIVSRWQVPAGHKVKGMQVRCTNALRDALAGFEQLKDSDARVKAAMATPVYKYTPGEHLQVPDPTEAEMMAAQAGGM